MILSVFYEMEKVELINCPYDPNHWVKPTRLTKHINMKHQQPKYKKIIVESASSENWDDCDEGTYRPKIVVYYKNGKRKY